MIRAVHTGGIIDKVGIADTTPQAVLNAPALGHTQIAALAKHLAAQVAAIDSQTIVSAITDLGVALCRGFNVGAYATIPNKINRGFEKRSY